MRKITDKLKIAFGYEISASAVKATSSINEIVNRKFHQLNSRLDEIDIKVTEKNTSRQQQGQDRKVQKEKDIMSAFSLNKMLGCLKYQKRRVDVPLSHNACSALVIRGTKFCKNNE